MGEEVTASSTLSPVELCMCLNDIARVQAHLLLTEAAQAAEELRLDLTALDSPPPSPCAAESTHITAEQHAFSTAGDGNNGTGISHSTGPSGVQASADAANAASKAARRAQLPAAHAADCAAQLVHLLLGVLELGVKEEWLHVAAARPAPREAAALAAAAVRAAAPSAAADAAGTALLAERRPACFQRSEWTSACLLNSL